MSGMCGAGRRTGVRAAAQRWEQAVEGRRRREEQALKRLRIDSTRMVTASSPLPPDRPVSRSQDHLATTAAATATKLTADGPASVSETGPLSLLGTAM